MAAPSITAVILGALGKIVGPLIEGVKWLFTIKTVEKAAKTEERNETLETTNEAQKEQLEIAARPPTSWNAFLDRMRSGKR